MRCRKCGTLGYSRKTLTPKWRCRSGGCGFEWDDTPPSSDELVEELRLEADRRERDLRHEEKGRQRERQLLDEGAERHRKAQNKERGFGLDLLPYL